MYDASAVLDHLEKKDVPYHVDYHPWTATAQETAEAEHVSGKWFAKTVVVKSHHKVLLAILPAHLMVDLDKLSALSGLGSLRLAWEQELGELFPDSEVGAMPPFGGLYRQPCAVVPTPIDVYLDDDLAVAPKVTFNACSHQHTVTVNGKDFLKAIEARVGDISED